MAICRLCKNDRVLRNSHIVPAFLYSDLYNAKGHMMGISGLGNRGWDALQQGIREYLFCDACEQLINDCYEKPFLKQWVEAKPLPDPWVVKDVLWIDVDYSSFKSFHLSVIFRAGVSSLPMFSEVSLGLHEERIRQLLLSRNAGSAWQYPLFAYAVVHHRTNRLIQMVSKAQRSKYGGRICYGIMYGGAQWWICVSSDKNHEFQKAALQPSGRMPFTAVPWNEVGVIQEASQALRETRHPRGRVHPSRRQG